MPSWIQQNQLENQMKCNERIKSDQEDLMPAVARLQNVQNKEVEIRVEQVEHLGVVVESLQEAVSSLRPQHEEIPE